MKIKKGIVVDANSGLISSYRTYHLNEKEIGGGFL
jgi:hypothetical protein